MINLLRDPSHLSPQAKSAFRSSLALMVAAVLAVPIYLYIAIQIDAWQMYMTLTALVLFAGFAIVSTRLCFLGQTNKGIWVLLVSNVGAAIVASQLIAGLGLPLGLMTFVVVLQLATQNLPATQSFRAIVLGIVAAIVMGLIDYINPSFQYIVPSLRSVTFSISIVVLLLYAVAIVRQFSTFPLRNKLLLSFLMVTFFSVGMVAAVTVRQTRQVLLTNANQSLLAAANQTALSLDTFITNNLNALRIEAGFPDFVAYLELPEAERLGSPEESRVRRLLLQLSRKDPTYIVSYALIDKNGIHIADTFFLEQGLDASNLNYFLEPRTTRQPYVSSVEQSLTEGGFSLHFSAPVRNASGEFVGVLRTTYNAGVIQQLINQNTGLLGETSGAVLLDSYGIRLADGFDSSQIMKSVVPLAPDLVAALQAQRLLPNRSLETLSTNVETFAAGLANVETNPVFDAEIHSTEDHIDTVAVASMQTRPWQVAFAIAQSAYLDPIEAQTQTTTIVALIVALLVALTTTIVAQVLTTPITRLTTVAEQVAAGDLNVRVAVETEDEIGKLAQTFNLMTGRVHDLVNTLEIRVQERTLALETTKEVSRRLSTILDPQQLVEEVVEQVRSAFNYYHAHIYFLNEYGDYLLMAGGTGEAGKKLLAQGHKIPVGRGLVGRAAQTNAPVLVSDVSTDSNWLANPLLPETKSEVAVPIALGGTVLGVLDVQHNIAGGLTSEDTNLLQSISNQVAVALQNARSYEAAHRRANQETIVNTLARDIQRATRVEEVLQIVATGLSQSLELDRAVVQVKSTTSSNGKSQEKK